MKLVVLYTDVVMWLLASGLIAMGIGAARRKKWALKWREVFRRPMAQASFVVLMLFFMTALVDSIHWQPKLTEQAGEAVVYDVKTVSLLDTWLAERAAARERSYSAPWALRDFDKTTVLEDGRPVRDFQRLKGVSADVDEAHAGLVLGKRFFAALLTGVMVLSLWWLVLAGLHKMIFHTPFTVSLTQVTARTNPARPAIQVLQLAILGAVLLSFLWPVRHVLGTDAVGNDVLLSAVKSIRTAVVIGSLSTLSALPFAVVLGLAAGYFRGWVDDVVQYVYTTISSIPSVLLIAASVLMIQVFIDKNPGLYATGLERADLRLALLAIIIGVTSWATLARLLRAETMKTAAMDYVAAARSFGVPAWKILWRHILPNVVHIVLIVAVLDFSGLVLYEAVLSYVGVGVDPSMASFGTMINAAAGEMSRTPVIWWNLAAAFLFMGTLVLAANLFASAVREVFDRKRAPQISFFKGEMRRTIPFNKK